MKHGGKLQRSWLCPTNTGPESGSKEERNASGEQHVIEGLLRDVVRRVFVGSRLLPDLTPARRAPLPRHPPPAQAGPLPAHRHSPHGRAGPSLRGRPHQCRHRRSLQSSREDHDFLGGSGFRGGTVVLRPGHLLPQNTGHPLAAPGTEPQLNSEQA